MKFIILDLVKSTESETNHAAAARAGKWYDKYLQSGGRWVTIKEGPLEGRHILIDGHGYVAGGKGIPRKLLDKWNGNRHKDNLPPHGPSVSSGPEGPPYPAPAPEPAPAPKPEPAPSGKGEKPAKTGHGAGATMHVVDGDERTIKHIKNLKHVHGGKWNGEHQRWEFNHTHDSEGHKALEDYANKAGLKLNLHEKTEGGEAPAPSPQPAPAPGASNEGGKAGKVTIGGNSYPHKFALKTEHGAQWNKDSKAWEVPDVAHGSDKHKAIQDFAKERGLTADHEHDERVRDFNKENVSDIIKNPPTRQEILNHLSARTNGEMKPDDPYFKDRADKIEGAIKSFKDNPHLIPHADADVAYRREDAPDFDSLFMLHNRLKHAEEAHADAENSARLQKEYEEEKARKKLEDEAKAKETAAGAKPLEGELGDWIQNPPDVAAIKSHLLHKYIEKYKKGNGKMPEQQSLDYMDPQHQAQAAEIRDALNEIKKNPALDPHVRDYLHKEMSKFYNQNDNPLEHLRAALAYAITKARMKVHKTADGKTVEVDPQGHRYGLPSRSGLRQDSYNGSKIVTVSGRNHQVPMPKDMKKFTQDHVGRFVEGAGAEAHAFIHHVLSGNTDPFTHDTGGVKAKPTESYKPFAEPPEKNKTAYMEQAKQDMMAHGARAVVFTNSGSADERAHSAKAIASGLRVMHHMLGGALPPVELVIGNIKGSALAHYRAGYRSITIDPKVGRFSFLHEYGHFLDDAMHGFSGLGHNSRHIDTAGNYNHNTPLHAVAQALSNTQAHKDKIAEHEKRGYDRQFRSYYKQDKEIFARFFAQWVPHEARKAGMALPPELDEKNDDQMKNYGEAYTPEELDKVGELVKKALKDKGLWKAFEAFLLGLSRKQPSELKFVISV